MALTIKSLGPFLGVQDGRNPVLDAAGIARQIKHGYLRGFNQLIAEPGSNVAMTLMDDQGSPAACTSVVYCGMFADFALALGHSTVTDKVYLYLLAPDFSGWYDDDEVFTASASATPLAVVWTSITEPPPVTVAELLNVAYIAHNGACDATAFYFATRQLSKPASTWTIANVTGQGNPCYFLGVAAFQGHLLAWGFTFGATPATSYRPELVRFGAPVGGAIDGTGSGSFTVGHRVRSKRESVVNITVASDVAYIGTPFSIWPLIGYGRDTWDKSEPLDDSIGVAGPQSACAADKWLYYWSSRGPMRVLGRGEPEDLYTAIPQQVAAVIDPQKIVAVYDPDRDRVLFFYRAGAYTGNQLVCAYDVVREKFVSADTDIGFPVACANVVAPIVPATQSGAQGPDGPPTSPVTSEVFQGSAKCEWTNGDDTLENTTILEYRVQGGGAWTQAAVLGSGVASAYLTGLEPSTSYEWRVYHRRFGIDSAILGPSVATQFTTSTTCRNPVPGSLSFVSMGQAFTNQGFVQWTNSIEVGVSTEVELAADPFSSFVLQETCAPGVSSTFITVGASGQYQVRIRHVKSGLTPSSYQGPAQTELFYGPAT